MREFLSGLFEVSLTMGAVTALLLVLSPVWKRRFRPQWRCWAWLLVALRLAVPFNVSLPRAPVVLEAPAPAAVSAAWVEEGGFQGVELTARTLPPGEAAPEAAGRGVSLTTAELAFAAWAAVAAGVLAARLLRYAAFRRRTARWCTPAGAYEGVPVYACALLSSPALTGLLRPRILLPEGVEGERRAFALAHEAMHARRRDLWSKALLLWVCALHWFNPLVWLLRRAAERDMEIACDAAVLAGRDGEWRRRYGAALLSFVPAGRPAPLTSQFAGGARGLKERFRALMDASAKRPGRAALLLVLCAALLGGPLVACQSRAPEESLPDGTYWAIPMSATDWEEAGKRGRELSLRSVTMDPDTMTVTTTDGFSGISLPVAEDVVLGGGETELSDFLNRPDWGTGAVLELEVTGGKITALTAWEARFSVEELAPDGDYIIGNLYDFRAENASGFPICFKARMYEVEEDTWRVTNLIGTSTFRVDEADLCREDGTPYEGGVLSFLNEFCADSDELYWRRHPEPYPFVNRLTLQATVRGGYITSLTRLPEPEW